MDYSLAFLAPYISGFISGGLSTVTPATLRQDGWNDAVIAYPRNGRIGIDHSSRKKLRRRIFDRNNVEIGFSSGRGMRFNHSLIKNP